jgi:monoamine oxidase
MEGSVKFAVEYEKAFWLDNGFSGMVFSQTGLIAELYDHSSDDLSKFALMGFLNGNATRYNQEQRKEIVLQQISNLYGEFATEPISYHDKLWDHKYISTSDNDFLAPHHNNGHRYLHQPYLGGKFFLAGTETISRYPGYLDAAIASAHRVVSSII